MLAWVIAAHRAAVTMVVRRRRAVLMIFEVLVCGVADCARTVRDSLRRPVRVVVGRSCHFRLAPEHQPSTSFYPKCRGSLHGGAQRVKLRGGVPHRSTSVTRSASLRLRGWSALGQAPNGMNHRAAEGAEHVGAPPAASRRQHRLGVPRAAVKAAADRVFKRDTERLQPGGHGGLAGLKTGDLTQSRRRIILRA